MATTAGQSGVEAGCRDWRLVLELEGGVDDAWRRRQRGDRGRRASAHRGHRSGRVGGRGNGRINQGVDQRIGVMDVVREGEAGGGGGEAEEVAVTAASEAARCALGAGGSSSAGDYESHERNGRRWRGGSSSSRRSDPIDSFAPCHTRTAAAAAGTSSGAPPYRRCRCLGNVSVRAWRASDEVRRGSSPPLRSSVPRCCPLRGRLCLRHLRGL